MKLPRINLSVLTKAPRKDAEPRRVNSVALLHPASDAIQNLEGHGVSQKFQKAVAKAFNKLPASSTRVFTEGGYKIVLTPFVSTAFPYLKDKQAYGYPEGETCDYSIGFHRQPQGKEIILAEHYFGEPKKTVLDTLSYLRRGKFPMANLLRHEIGHAWNHLFRRGNYVRLSDFPSFLTAHRQDLSRMSEERKQKNEYFIQPTCAKAGRNEAFAEAFAALTGGGCRNNVQRFKDDFPKVCQWVRERLGQMAQIAF